MGIGTGTFTSILCARTASVVKLHSCLLFPFFGLMRLVLLLVPLGVLVILFILGLILGVLVILIIPVLIPGVLVILVILANVVTPNFLFRNRIVYLVFFPYFLVAVEFAFSSGKE